MPGDGKVPYEPCAVLLDVSGIDVEPPLGNKVPLDEQVLDVHADLSVVLFISGNIFEVVLLLDVVDVLLTIFNVVLLVDDCDELLKLNAVGFNTIFDAQRVVEAVLRILLYDVL